MEKENIFTLLRGNTEERVFREMLGRKLFGNNQENKSLKMEVIEAVVIFVNSGDSRADEIKKEFPDLFCEYCSGLHTIMVCQRKGIDSFLRYKQLEKYYPSWEDFIKREHKAIKREIKSKSKKR